MKFVYGRFRGERGRDAPSCKCEMADGAEAQSSRAKRVKIQEEIWDTVL